MINQEIQDKDAFRVTGTYCTPPPLFCACVHSRSQGGLQKHVSNIAKPLPTFRATTKLPAFVFLRKQSVCTSL